MAKSRTRYLLEHMQAMQRGLEKKIADSKREVKHDIQNVKTEIIAEMNRRHDALSEDIAAIIEDATTVKERIHVIETERLPRIETKLGIA